MKKPVIILALALLGLWTFGIIWLNGPFPANGIGNTLLALLWVAALAAVVRRVPTKKTRRLAVTGLFLLPILPYLLIRPSHHRQWSPQHAVTSRAEVSGDTVIIRGFRSFDYAPDGSPLEKWSTRTYDLNRLVAMDFFMSSWDAEMIGHPIFSFDFGEQGHLAFTVEARLEEGETYGLLPGLYKRYELAFIPSEESDSVRLRTNFRQGEHVRLYRTIATPEIARRRFLEFVGTMNDIAEKPRFYNVISSNCTTAVRAQMRDGFPMDWRVIINGRLDELLYRRQKLVTAGLPFAELKQRALINEAARKITTPGDFSRLIRKDRPGF